MIETHNEISKEKKQHVEETCAGKGTSAPTATHSSTHLCFQGSMRLSWTPPPPKPKTGFTLCPPLPGQTPCIPAELRCRRPLLGTAPPSAAPRQSRPETPTGRRPPSGPGSAAAARSPQTQPRSVYVRRLVKEELQSRRSRKSRTCETICFRRRPASAASKLHESCSAWTGSSCRGRKPFKPKAFLLWLPSRHALGIRRHH